MVCLVKWGISYILFLNPKRSWLWLFGFTTTVSSGLLSQNFYKCAPSCFYIAHSSHGRSSKLSCSESHQFTFLTHQWHRSRSLRLLAATSIIFSAMFCTLEHNHPLRNMLHLWQWITLAKAEGRFQDVTGTIWPLFSEWTRGEVREGGDEGGGERARMSLRQTEWQRRHTLVHHTFLSLNHWFIFSFLITHREDYLWINNHVSACQQIIGALWPRQTEDVASATSSPHIRALVLIMKWHQKQWHLQVLQ